MRDFINLCVCAHIIRVSVNCRYTTVERPNPARYIPYTRRARGYFLELEEIDTRFDERSISLTILLFPRAHTRTVHTVPIGIF